MDQRRRYGASTMAGGGPSRKASRPTSATAGVLRRLVEEPDALARVIRAALEICHFDPSSGDEASQDEHTCARACYRCLLSYSNQPYHAVINRRAIRAILLELSTAQVTQDG